MGSLFNGLFREAALAFARHFIAGFGVWLVARHYASQQRNVARLRGGNTP